jgi:altronate hydrolase
MPTVLQIHPGDNVAVALAPLAAGQVVEVAGMRLTAQTIVPAGHKLALTAIAQGASVIKYGHPIGHATETIPPGTWVHSHNLRTNLRGPQEYVFKPSLSPAPPEWTGRETEKRGNGETEIPSPDRAAQIPESFQGYLRGNGEAGVRNELWIIPTVGCVNATATNLARQFARELPPGVEGVHALTHPYGCSQLGDDHRSTRKILARLARHPNAGGVLVLGLGCENNSLAEFRAELGDFDPARFRFLVAQEVADEEAAGLQCLEALAKAASEDRRQSLPASKLRLGLKCGGSDGFSGITANPLLGAVSDRLIAEGGSALLTEVPEMFGAETILMNRCVSPEIFTQFTGMINQFKDYFLRHGQEVYENPSPGNKEGGITTLEEKSLGCVQKGGQSAVSEVLPYGGRASRPGLGVLNGPGNDIVSVTALAATGAQMILFTTGRGTPLGGPVPTLKISTNTALAQRKGNWIDFDAGRLLAGESQETLVEALWRTVLAIASGQELTRAERNGYREIAILKGGVTL